MRNDEGEVVAVWTKL